ncbi:MAG: IF-2-associated domain-containing protein [Magnetococcus sp. DMHC-6]
MGDTKQSGDGDDPLQLKAPRRIVLRKTVEGGSIKQNFSHGRSKSVVVEVRRKKTFIKAKGDHPGQGKMDLEARAEEVPSTHSVQVEKPADQLPDQKGKHQILKPLSPEERAQIREKLQREMALEQAKHAQEISSSSEPKQRSNVSPTQTAPPTEMPNSGEKPKELERAADVKIVALSEDSTPRVSTPTAEAVASVGTQAEASKPIDIIVPSEPPPVSQMGTTADAPGGYVPGKSGPQPVPSSGRPSGPQPVRSVER